MRTRGMEVCAVGVGTLVSSQVGSGPGVSARVATGRTTKPMSLRDRNTCTGCDERERRAIKKPQSSQSELKSYLYWYVEWYRYM